MANVDVFDAGSLTKAKVMHFLQNTPGAVGGV
jgi:hypothetical protein